MSQTLVCVAVLATAGCGGIGPGRMTADRFDYTAAVSESWKSQMLLNLVKIRYSDVPVFLDIGQIVAGYSFSRNVSATGTFPVYHTAPLPHAILGTLGLSGQGTFNDSPTVTYAPLAGERFARQMMMPLPMSSILNLLQAGFPVDAVFRLGVQSVNGVDNRRVQVDHVQPANPEFYALLRDLRRIQGSGDIGVRIQRSDKGETLSLVFRPNLAAAIESALRNVAQILGLDPTAREFRVVYGAVASDDKEIAIVSRSMHEVLKSLSSFITVPEAHVTERRVSPTPAADLGPEGPLPPLIRIDSSANRPADVFVTAPYHGYWFSIDDRDVRSKAAFSFILFLFTFLEKAEATAPPILTIPTTR